MLVRSFEGSGLGYILSALLPRVFCPEVSLRVCKAAWLCKQGRCSGLLSGSFLTFD